MTGMAEAERQIAVARRLYAASGRTPGWDRLNLEGRRPWIDLACTPGHVGELA